MKKFISGSMITIGLLINNNSFAMDKKPSKPGVYLENDYGADILYKEGGPKDRSTEFILRNGERLYLGTFGKVGLISIRTNKYLSPFKDLAPYISEVDMESLQFPDHNAIIIIKPSRIIDNWDIDTHWEAKDRNVREILVFDELSPDTLNKNYESLANALGENYETIAESLGYDYSQKIKNIYEYDYTKAIKGGFINLKDELIKEIKNINNNMYTITPRRIAKRAQGKVGPWRVPDLSTIEDLKKAIDRLSRALEKYRVRDNQ